MEGFESSWGFAQAAGTVDHKCSSDYFNHKGFYSVLMQGLVDFREQFMDVCIRWPGKVHDVRVFSNFSIYKKAVKGKLFPPWTRKIILMFY